MRKDSIFTAIILSLVFVVSSSFLSHANVAVPLDFNANSGAVKVSSTWSYNHKIRFPQCRLVSCKLGAMKHSYMRQDDSNITGSSEAAMAHNETRTTGYRPIEEWHEETHDPKHVIQQLKQEKARWSKTFRDMQN